MFSVLATFSHGQSQRTATRQVRRSHRHKQTQRNKLSVGLLKMHQAKEMFAASWHYNVMLAYVVVVVAVAIVVAGVDVCGVGWLEL